MGKKGFPYSRQSGSAPYKRKIIVIAEGKGTEPSYIDAIKVLMDRGNREILFNVSCRRPDNSSVPHVIKKAEDKEKTVNMAKGDQIWVAVDRDSESHTLDQMRELRQWEEGMPNRHVAYSAPRFEFWLLLHFESYPSENNAKNDKYMDKFIPGYSEKKKLNPARPGFILENVQAAINRAKHWDKTDYCDPPRVGTSFDELARLLLNPQ